MIMNDQVMPAHALHSHAVRSMFYVTMKSYIPIGITAAEPVYCGLGQYAGSF
jgi:hypothetical protein